MKIKVKKPEIPVALFKVDREKLIPCYIPEFEGKNNYEHNILSLILSNADFENGSIYDTQQMAEEIAMLKLSETGKDRYYAEFYVAQISSDASQKGLFNYEYLGDTKWDYGHYVRYSKSPLNKKKDRK